MKTRTLFIALVGLGLALGSCKKSVKPSNDITTEIRPVSGFTAIDVSEAMDVEIMHIPGTEQVVVEANSNLHKYIITEVVSGTLFIHREDNVNFKPGAKIKVYVTASTVNDLEISGASNVQLTNQLTMNGLGLDISGASHLSGGIDVGTVSMEISGASTVDLFGVATNVTADVSGASLLKDYNLVIENLTIDLSGASTASLTVNGLMNITASGASTLNYKGDGLIGDLNLSGASSVNKQ